MFVLPVLLGLAAVGAFALTPRGASRVGVTTRTPVTPGIVAEVGDTVVIDAPAVTPGKAGTFTGVVKDASAESLIVSLSGATHEVPRTAVLSVKKPSGAVFPPATPVPPPPTSGTYSGAYTS